MGQTNALIKIKDLNVTYFSGKPNEVRALKKINLEIYPGEFVIFFGPSGCGKSTLLYSIAGLETNITGDIYVGGKNIAKLNCRETEEFHQKRTGMIFQAYYLVDSLNVLENVILPQMAVGADKKEREKKALELLGHFGVKEQADKFPNELSGGQQQRVAISRALVNNPEILLADEPLGNLDSKAAQDVMSLLADLNERSKKTVILVTHNPAFLNIAHRVFYVKDGAIVDTRVNEERKKIAARPEDKEAEAPISKELEMLARTFSGISGAAGSLLIPFKAKQIVSEVLLEMSGEEVGAIEKKVENLLIAGMRSIEDSFFKYLDEEIEKGGLGMDKRSARRVSDQVKDIMKEISILEKMDREISSGKRSWQNADIEQIRGYLLDSFRLKVSDPLSLKIMDGAIKMRVTSKIDKEGFFKKIDLPLKEGGAGIDKRVTKKIARRLELLILGKYK
ncbi:MAG: ABC transporter ATP-binding protein [Patescibacteria group bacterium]|nr:ABC transporter ATP-binding protein [Patescibacteria group bacterium]